MFDRPSIRKDLDWLTVGMYVLLVGLGWLTIFSSLYELGGTNPFAFDSLREASQTVYVKQLIWITLAALLAWAVLSLDAYFLAQTAYVSYGIMLVLLVLVLVVGKEVKGAKAWFDLGFMQLQPAEFAKFATALALARYLGTPQVRLMRFPHFLLVGLILLVPVGLILLENETGSALVFFAFAVALYREGLPGGLMLAGLSAIFLLIATLLNLKDLWVLLQQLLYFWAGIALLMSVGGYLKTRPDYRPPWYVPALESGVILLLLAGFWMFLHRSALPESQLEDAMSDVPFVQLPAAQASLRWMIGGVGGLFLLSLVLMLIYKKTYSRFVWVFLLAIFSLSVVGGLDFFVKGVLQPHQQRRLQVLINPDADTQGAGYHVANSKMAIGSGSWTGKGYLEGTFTKLRYVPDQHTDFIFCTFAEEWGWMGSSLLMLLFGLFLLRLIYLAERQRSRFSRVYGYCVVSVFLFHFIINIGMTMGLVPVIGIPLPFFSYGGSSLFSFTLLLFIFLKLDVFRKQKLIH
ncbi:MAG: rod shape-determining protein RodA [Bernardetiaceae bacterium]